MSTIELEQPYDENEVSPWVSTDPLVEWWKDFSRRHRDVGVFVRHRRSPPTWRARYSLAAIGKELGMDSSTIAKILRGNQQTVRRDVADSILTVCGEPHQAYVLYGELDS